MMYYAMCPCCISMVEFIIVKKNNDYIIVRCVKCDYNNKLYRTSIQHYDLI